MVDCSAAPSLTLYIIVQSYLHHHPLQPHPQSPINTTMESHRPQKRMCLDPLSPLDVPMILETIGTFLGPSDLCACALVNRHWHSHFAPFLYWLALEDCDAIVQRLYDNNIAFPLEIGAYANYKKKNIKAGNFEIKPFWKVNKFKTQKVFDPKYRLEADYLSHIDTLLRRIEHPSTSSVVHRRARRVLSCQSLMSLILLGTLCDKVREISFSFKAPPTFISPGPGIDPQVCALSTTHIFSQERPDRVIEVIERNTHLKRVVLIDDCEKRPVVYRWVDTALQKLWCGMQSPLNAPRWPDLRLVQLSGCVLDGSFLRTLFVNTPRLKSLRLDKITVQSTSNSGTDFELLDVHPDANPALEELMIFRPKDYPIGMQMDLARVQPNLISLSLTYDKQFQAPLFIAPGFYALRRLRIHLIGVGAAGCHMGALVKSAGRLEDLWIGGGGVVIDEALALAIIRHRQTLTKLVIDIPHWTMRRTYDAPGSLNDPENPLHMILRSCHALLSCTFSNLTLNCNPAEFDRPWGCHEIEELIITPDCEPKDLFPEESSYTPLQAQSALFLQLSRLRSLKTLGFSGGVGSRSFHVEDHLRMLCKLEDLEELQLYSSSLETNPELTVEHGRLVTQYWPRLKAIRGLMHVVSKPFVEYVRIHRPDLDLTY